MSEAGEIFPAPSSFHFALPEASANANGGATIGDPPAPENLFNSIGGPALIVIFSALALFAVALVALLVLHARRRRRNYPFLFDSPARLRKPPPYALLAEKPALRELPLARYKSGLSRDSLARWRNMMPLSVVLLADKAEESWTKDLERTESYSSISTFDIMRPSPSRNAIARAMGSFPWRNQMGNDASGIHTHHPQISPAVIVPDRVQVAVAIAMPHPSTNLTASAETSGGVMREDRKAVIPEFCLGIAEVEDGDHEKQDMASEWSNMRK